MTSQIAARRTRFGRASRPPVRYEPEETPLDDGSEVETADVDEEDLESDASCETESESDDDEEAGSLEDFVVPDGAGVTYESSDEDDEESGAESEKEDPMSE